MGPRIRMTTPTIKGARRVRVGAHLFGVPESADVRRVRLGSARRPAAYVLTAGRTLHLLVIEAGRVREVVMTPSVAQQAASAYFGAHALPSPQSGALRVQPDDPGLTVGQRLGRRRLRKVGGT